MTAKWAKSDMVENVARALGWEGDDASKEAFFDAARRAIEAMRQPSRRMAEAACAAMSPGKRPTDKRVSERAKHAIRYRAMIDAALASPPTPGALE